MKHSQRLNLHFKIGVLIVKKLKKKKKDFYKNKTILSLQNIELFLGIFTAYRVSPNRRFMSSGGKRESQ